MDAGKILNLKDYVGVNPQIPQGEDKAQLPEMNQLLGVGIAAGNVQNVRTDAVQVNCKIAP